MEKVITYCGAPMRVACDEKCEKAWGINGRPRLQIDPSNEDDYAFLADGELGEAPSDPGTYEGDHAKPVKKEGVPNKWCVRECERCYRSRYGKSDEAPVLPDFSERRYNIPRRGN
jgi:hypothetical protein